MFIWLLFNPWHTRSSGGNIYNVSGEYLKIGGLKCQMNVRPFLLLLFLHIYYKFLVVWSYIVCRNSCSIRRYSGDLYFSKHFIINPLFWLVQNKKVKSIIVISRQIIIPTPSRSNIFPTLMFKPFKNSRYLLIRTVLIKIPYPTH